MQLGCRVVGPGEGAAAKAGRPHPEVAAVLLDQDVGRHLRRAEQAVQGAIDGHVLADPVRVGVLGVDLPPRLELDERQRVGQVAVDLVGRGEDEHRLRGMRAGRLEHVQGADRVDVEVGERLLGRPVVRGLRGGVDHELDRVAVAGEDLRRPPRGRGCRRRGGGSARPSAFSSRDWFQAVDASGPKNTLRMSLSIPTTSMPRPPK